MVNDHVRFGKSSENLFSAQPEGPTFTTDSNTGAAILITLQSIQRMERLLLFLYPCNDIAARQNLRFNTSIRIRLHLDRCFRELARRDVQRYRNDADEDTAYHTDIISIQQSLCQLRFHGTLWRHFTADSLRMHFDASIVEHTIQPHLLEPYLAFYRC